MADNLSILIERILSRLSSGENVEEDKLEVKREWHNLRELKDLNEFLKDIVAIANTPGLTGYLVIGIDKNGALYDSPFSKSSLRDHSDIHNLLVKHVDLPFRIQIHEIPWAKDGKEITLTVLEIPPSIEKPHFIRNYVSKSDIERANYIPIRKTNGVFPATRSDVEFMYYDRKNVEPDFLLSITSHKPRLSVNVENNQTRIDFQLAFQNSGRRPIALAESFMTILEAPEIGIQKDFVLKLEWYAEHGIQDQRSYIQNRYVKIPSNQIESLMVTYLGNCDSVFGRTLREARGFLFRITATDTNGNSYQSEILKRQF